MHKIHTDWAIKLAKILIKDKDDYMLLILENLLTGISKNQHEGVNTSKFVYWISLRLNKKKAKQELVSLCPEEIVVKKSTPAVQLHFSSIGNLTAVVKV